MKAGFPEAVVGGVQESLPGVQDTGGMARVGGDFVVFGHSKAQAVYSRYLDGDTL